MDRIEQGFMVYQYGYIIELCTAVIAIVYIHQYVTHSRTLTLCIHNVYADDNGI